MMPWSLFLLITLTASVSTSSVIGFADKKGCLDGAKAIEERFTRNNIAAKWFCISSTGEIAPVLPPRPPVHN